MSSVTSIAAIVNLNRPARQPDRELISQILDRPIVTRAVNEYKLRDQPVPQEIRRLIEVA